MDIDKHLEKAQDAVRRKNFDGAISLFEQLLKLQPDHLRARKSLYEAALRRYEHKRPMKALLLASASPALAGAKSFYAMKRWQQAADQYQNAFLLDPQNVSWGLSLGECFELVSWKEAALAVYEHLFQADPNNQEALKRAGVLYYAKKDLAQALECYEKVLAINPRDQEALKARKNLAAEGILQEKGFETARSSRDLIKDKDLQNKLQATPRVAPEEPPLDTDAQQLRRMEEEIEALRQQNPTDEAKIKELQKAKTEWELERVTKQMQERPTDMGLRFRLGKLLLNASRIEDAIAEFQRAVGDPRWKLDCHVLLGQCFYKKGLYELARKQLEKALEQSSPGSGKFKEILYNLGLIAQQMGSNSDAVGYFSRIYEIDIGYRDVAQKMERLRSGA